MNADNSSRASSKATSWTSPAGRFLTTLVDANGCRLTNGFRPSVELTTLFDANGCRLAKGLRPSFEAAGFFLGAHRAMHSLVLGLPECDSSHTSNSLRENIIAP
jgi:hypothetical protein